MTTLFKNFRLISGGKSEQASLLCRGETIEARLPAQTTEQADCVIDGEGRLLLSPGFIDIHVHGGAGFDFMDADPDEYLRIAEHHARHGTTSMMPTSMTASDAETEQLFAAYRRASRFRGKGSKMLGLHLEGPYLSPAQKGAQDDAFIHKIRYDEYHRLFSLSDDVRRVTLAPELEHAEELVNYLSAKGILTSFGHSEAKCTEVLDIHEKTGGLNIATHLYSAMSMTHRIGAARFGGCVEAAYLCEDIYAELICDGIHLPPELIRLAFQIKGPRRLALITDAMRASGVDCTESILGSRRNGLPVYIEEGVAKTADRTAFAGSIATTDRLLRTVVAAGIPLEDAILSLTETPAEILGLSDRLGSLDAGKCADLVLLDDRLQIQSVVIEGVNILKY